MDWKKAGKAVLFPPIALLIFLLPLSITCLVYAMVCFHTESVVAIFSYVLSAYTLTVWCFRIPYWIRLFRIFRQENPYLKIWREDSRLRMKVSLYGTLIYNTTYALFQLALGFWHQTFWFYSMAGYYLALAGMRFFLVRHTSRHKPGEKMREELVKYRACGWVFLLMNLTLSVMVFFMIYWNRTFYHHEITTIALATYTFSAFTISIIKMVKYRKHNSPVYAASKAISFAAACVSMITLESTMLTTFGQDSMGVLSRKIFLGVTGSVVSALIILMAVYMILQSGKKIKALKE